MPEEEKTGKERGTASLVKAVTLKGGEKASEL